MLLGGTLAVASWMNGLFWIKVPHIAAFLIRAALAVAVLQLLIFYLRRWPRRHARSLPDPSIRLTLQNDDNFSLLNSAERLGLLESTLLSLGSIDIDAKAKLLRQVIAPTRVRRRTIEVIEVAGRTLRHNVKLEFAAETFVQIGSRYYVLLSRPKKDQNGVFLNFSAETTRNQQLQMLSFAEGAALVFALCLEHLGSLSTLSSAQATEIKVDLAELILSNKHPRRPGEIYEKALRWGLISRANASRCKTLLSLLTIASLRRPLFAATNEKEVVSSESVTFRYDRAQLYDLSYHRYEWWRSRKDAIRRRLRYPSRMVYVSFEHARSSGGYELTVVAPTGLYVDEAGALNRHSKTGHLHWLPPIDREEIRKSYIGWEEPRGRPVSNLGTRSFERTSYRDPFYCLRFMEIPPGTMGAATLTAIAVVITTWLCGALPPDSTRANVDIVAFIIALPAFLSSFFSLLSRGSTDRLYRSLSALLSLFVSSTISLASLVLYLGRNSKNQHIHPTIFWHKRTILFVEDYLWFLLLVFAIANLVVIGGTLLMRTAKYQRQLARH